MTKLCASGALIEYGILIVALLCLVLLVVILLRKSNPNGDIKNELNEQFNKIKLINENLEKIIDSNNEQIMRTLYASKSESNQNIHAFKTEQTQILQNVEVRVKNLLTETETRLSNIDKTIRETLYKINMDNNEKLDKMRETVDEKLNTSLEKRLNDSFAIISERLEKVHKGLGEMRSLATGVDDLKHTLSNIKIRGVWGEVQLGNILEQMLSHIQYASQVQIKRNSKEAVDYVIKMPGKNDDEIVLLPIDAKFPLEDYQRLVEASELGIKEDVEKAQKALEKRIKDEAKKINEKYIDPPKTTDFAVMYLALEGLYAEVVKNAGLLEYLQDNYRIIVCGPTTLSALINSLQMGFKSVAIEKRSSEVWALLSTFKTEFVKFVDLLAKTQKKLDEASTTIEDATKKSKRIQKKLDAVAVVDGTKLIEVEQVDLLDENLASGTDD